MPKEKTPPTEFIEFLRDVGVKAVDHLAERVEKREHEAADVKPLRKIARHWKDMTAAEKHQFFEHVISAAQMVAAAAPAVMAGVEAVRRRRKKVSADAAIDVQPTTAGAVATKAGAVRHYDPDEVEKTLPKAGKAKSKSKE
jgi:hypothetical protein